MTQPKVTFLPSKHTVLANKGETLLDVAVREDVALEHVCGGSMSCTTCHVVVQKGYDGLETPEEEELDLLEGLGKYKQQTSRLACQTEILADLTVQIL